MIIISDSSLKIIILAGNLYFVYPKNKINKVSKLFVFRIDNGLFFCYDSQKIKGSNMMKKIIAGTIISSMALFALPNSELDLVLISKAAEKKAVVLSNMKLKGETKENFGKLYDEYQLKLMKHRMDEITLITNYAKTHKNMTNENSDKLITEWLTVEEAELALKKEYMAKFKKVMPSSDVIRYFQIENRIQLLREAKTASQIPLATPTAVKVETK